MATRLQAAVAVLLLSASSTSWSQNFVDVRCSAVSEYMRGACLSQHRAAHIGPEQVIKTATSAPAHASTFGFRIVSTADVSVPAMTRPLSSYSTSELRALPKNERREVRIVVTGPVDVAHVEQAMRAAVAQVTAANPDIDEVAVLAYDRAEDASGAFTLGRLEWAPAAGWSGVTPAIAQSNDHTGYAFTSDLRDHVRHPVAEKDKPTARELKIYDRMMADLNAQPDVAEDILMPRIAKKLGLTVDQLDAIFIKVRSAQE